MQGLSIVMVPLALSCSQVQIKDEVFYATKGVMGATAIHTLAPGQQNIKFQDWLTLLRTKPLVCSSIDTFGDFKKAIEQLCSVCNCCNYDSKQSMENFFSKLQKAGK